MKIRKINRKYIVLFILVILLLTGCEKNPQQNAATVILPSIPTVSPSVTSIPFVTPTEIPITISPTETPLPEPTITPSPVPTVAPTPTTVPIETTIKQPVVISGLDKEAECVSVKNLSDKDIDLTGWYIVSVTGNQKYKFPNGYKIKAGAEIKVVSSETEGDLHWTKANVWNNSKSDPAELYNAEGKLQSRWDD